MDGVEPIRAPQRPAAGLTGSVAGSADSGADASYPPDAGLTGSVAGSADSGADASYPPDAGLTGLVAGSADSGTDRYYPPEFQRFVDQPESVTLRTARLFGVDPQQVTHWRWHMQAQVQSVEQVPGAYALSSEEREGFAALEPLFQAGVTPYYMTLASPAPDCPIRRQALPHSAERIDALGVEDPLGEVDHSPVPEVVQVYPDRVAFCVAQLCPVYCRYCFRKRRDEQQGLHFNRSIIERGIRYIASQPSIRDVLITGGDPFLASDEALVGLVRRLRSIEHVEIIRFGTRTPVTLPYRVTKQLADRLAAFHPVFVNTHFNCVEEVTPEAEQAVANLVNAGIPVGNQSVLLAGINDTPQAMMALLRALLRARVRPYYLFHPHYVAGTEHLRVPLGRGQEIMRALRGNITGLGLPNYVLDTPSGKIPVGPNYELGRDGDDLLVETIRGEIWREKAVYRAQGAEEDAPVPPRI